MIYLYQCQLSEVRGRMLDVDSLYVTEDLYASVSTCTLARPSNFGKHNY